MIVFRVLVGSYKDVIVYIDEEPMYWYLMSNERCKVTTVFISGEPTWW